jgi:beta-aspartyl-peptidase (threonine type)
MTLKRHGRVGDSPLIGAGTYAKNGVCAVSATGQGEYFIRAAAAHHVCLSVERRGLTLDEGVREVLHETIRALGGTGGIIAVDAQGRVVMDHSSETMLCAARDAHGRREIHGG